MKKLVYFVFVIFFMACEEGQVSRFCIEPPCGKIDPERFNIVLAMKQPYDISDIVLDVNGEKTPLSFGKELDVIPYFGCWNQTNIWPTPSLLSTLTFKLNGEIKSVIIEGATIITNAMVIEFKENDVINFDYRACIDTPTN